MKALVSFLLATCYFSFSYANCDTTLFEDEFKNGGRVTGQMVCDQKHGEWKFFDRKDRLIEKVIYKNGLMQGERSLWYPNGQEKSREQYDKGKFEGPVMHWSEEGQILVEEHYKNGLLEGVQKKWYEDGRLYSVIYFKQGKKNGTSE
ncbi:MAG: hypothetical protein MI810_02485, partial [Flavobacteriales bacterium]|nr:hypothetical protein [Flavobacteriales bacterium]